MAKYTIEGNVNFYDELYKSLDVKDTVDNGEKVCLITNLPLTEHSVKLECGHEFNYMALFHDISNHKQKFNAMEASHLRRDELRCPYCRKKQTKLLPYYPEMNVPKVNGVNFLDENHKNAGGGALTTKAGKCSHIYADINGQTVGVCVASVVLCIPVAEKYYCLAHRLTAYKNHLKDLKLKDKLQKQKEKEAIKVAAKEQLKLAKEMVKQAKLAVKLGKITDNVIIGPPTTGQTGPAGYTGPYICYESGVVGMSGPAEYYVYSGITGQEQLPLDTSKCHVILSSGKNKGKQCTYLAKKDNCCMKHYVAPSTV